MAKEISQERFDTILGDILQEEGRNLLTVPGVYEAVSEHFNNEVLQRYEEECQFEDDQQPDEDEPDEDDSDDEEGGDDEDGETEEERIFGSHGGFARWSNPSLFKR